MVIKHFRLILALNDFMFFTIYFKLQQAAIKLYFTYPKPFITFSTRLANSKLIYGLITAGLARLTILE